MIPEDIDHILSNLARTATIEDFRLRNALYAAYSPRLHRILLRYWYRNLREFGCDRDDLEQEAFLIFARLLESWSGNGSFSAYLHGAFPWRLFDAARRLSARERPGLDCAMAGLAGDDSFAAQEATILLDELARTLSPFDRALLVRHVRDGESLGVIAASHGMSARTVRRAWLRMRQHLQAQLATP